MRENKIDNRIPILRFFIRHKWRIILPVLFATFYFALPVYFFDGTGVQQTVFIKSSTLNKSELASEVRSIKNRVYSDEFLQNLVSKYDLYQTEKNNVSDESLKIDKLRKSIDIRLQDSDLTEAVGITIWIYFAEKDNSRHIMGISNDVFAAFESTKSLQVNRFVSKPIEQLPNKFGVFFARIILDGLIMISIPLILIWEIPFMFYSPKTKEMVFDPLRADWQNELLEAKLRNQRWRALGINIRYSCAFLAAMIQKSPIGDLIEFAGKFAK